MCLWSAEAADIYTLCLLLFLIEHCTWRMFGQAHTVGRVSLLWGRALPLLSRASPTAPWPAWGCILGRVVSCLSFLGPQDLLSFILSQQLVQDIMLTLFHVPLFLSSLSALRMGSRFHLTLQCGALYRA